MNTGTSEIPAATRNPCIPGNVEDIETLKRELMKAEVRLAKARATVVSAEIDIKVLNTRLKTLMK